MTIPADHVLKALLQTGRLPVPEGHAPLPDRLAASAFEVDLLRLGFRLDVHARDRLQRLGTEELRHFYDRSLPVIRRAVGDARHRHLFLHFPHLVVEDGEYLRWRAWTWVRSEEGRAAERLGLPSNLLLLEPCLHFVHQGTLAGHGACPICQVPVDRAGGEAFAPPEHRADDRRSPVRLLRGLNSEETALREVLKDGLGRRAPLAEHELLALRSAVLETPDSLLGRVLTPYLDGTQRVPGREALAQVTGTLLRDEDRRDVGLALLSAQLTSATDVLRACDVMGGGDGRLEDARGIGRSQTRATRNARYSTFGSARLTLADRRAGTFNSDAGAREDGVQTLGEARQAIQLPSLGRPLRRALLNLLEQRPAALLPEELHRHARAWTLLAERLHPLEDRRRGSVVAAFTTLRGGLRGNSEVPLPTGAGYKVIRGKPRHHGLVSDIEWAYRNHDVALAWTLSARRPGLLGRGLDRLVRHSHPDLLLGLSDRLVPAFSRLTLPMLLTLRGHLRGRTVPERENRSIRTRTGKVEVLPALPPLSPEVVAPIVEMLTDTLHRLPLSPVSPLRGLGVMQINEGCERMLVPLNLRTASEALELVPSGSRIPLNLSRGATPRLFVHWEEPLHSRVDLDLSAGFYDADWTLVSTCSFHDLSPRLQGRRVGQHSGDMQSAPAPHGATEFVDIDVDACRGAGVRYVAITVHSFTDIPFEELPECTSGVMLVPAEDARTATARSPFRPDWVLQALQLTGREQVRLTFALDLQEEVMTHADLPLTGRRTLMSSRDEVGRVLSTLEQDHRLRVRPTLQELAILQASRAAKEVRLVQGDLVYRVQRNTDLQFRVALEGLLVGDLSGLQVEETNGLSAADLVVTATPDDLGVGPRTRVVCSAGTRQLTGQPKCLSWLLDA